MVFSLTEQARPQPRIPPPHSWPCEAKPRHAQGGPVPRFNILERERLRTQ